MEPEEIVERAWRSMFPPGNRPTFQDYDEIFQPDFEWQPRTGDAVSGRTYRGRDGLVKYAQDLRESFSSFTPHSTVYEVAGDRVLACSLLKIRGAESGIEMTNEGGVIWELRDGLAASGRAFLSHAEAREQWRAHATA